MDIEKEATALDHKAEAHDMARLGVRITNAANDALGFEHPDNPNWRHISFCLFAGAVTGGHGAFETRSALRGLSLMDPGS